MKLLGSILAIIVTGVAMSPASAALRQPAYISFGDSADAPVGYLEMCERDRAACGLAADDAPLAAAAPCITPEPSPRGRRAIRDWTCLNGRDGAFSTAAIDRRSRRSSNIGANSTPDRPLTAKKIIGKINTRINNDVLQQSDNAIFGVDEYWKPSGNSPGATGDCEDIALQKQADLVAAGIPTDRLFLAVVYKSGVGLHTVLLVRTDEGDMVLDSLTSRIRHWHQTGFIWVRAQVPGSPLQWKRVA